MKIIKRVKEIEKKSELFKLYIILAAYPLVLIIALVVSPHTGPAIAVLLYIIYLVYIAYRFLKLGKIISD